MKSLLVKAGMAVAFAAVLGMAAQGALAFLTTDEMLRVLAAKTETQKAKKDAMEVLSSSQDPLARKAAEETIENLDRAFNRLERMLVE